MDPLRERERVWLALRLAMAPRRVWRTDQPREGARRERESAARAQAMRRAARVVQRTDPWYLAGQPAVAEAGLALRRGAKPRLPLV